MASFVILWPWTCRRRGQAKAALHHPPDRPKHAGALRLRADAGANAKGRPLIDWLTTTTHHDLHHAHSDSNFGLYFTWWDRWMGIENTRTTQTAFARAAPRLGALGLGRAIRAWSRRLNFGSLLGMASVGPDAMCFWSACRDRPMLRAVRVPVHSGRRLALFLNRTRTAWRCLPNASALGRGIGGGGDSLAWPPTLEEGMGAHADGSPIWG